MALRLPDHGRIGMQAAGRQLAQNFLIGTNLAAWRVYVFNANQPLALVRTGI